MLKVQNPEEKVTSRKFRCVYMVCPNNRRFNQTNLAKALDSFNLKHQFGEISILIADGELHAFSKSVKFPKMSFEECQKKSVVEVERWKKSLKEIDTSLHKIFHWDDLITSHKNFKQYLVKVKKDYEEIDAFRNALDESISAYLRKTCNDDVEKLDKNCLEWEKCFEYKIREVVGLYIKAELGFDFLGYPGDLCPGLAFALEHFINNENNDKLLFLKINLNSKSQKPINDPNVKNLETIIKDTARINQCESKQSSINLSKDGMFQNNLFNDKIFVLLVSKLQNCETPEELRYMLTVLQSIIMRFMIEDLECNQSLDKIINSRKYIKDNGICYNRS